MSQSTLALNTFKVIYSDGEEIIVKPVPWKLLEDVETLTKEIIILLLEVDGRQGELYKLSNTKFWGYAKKLAAMMPVVGQDTPGIDLDRIDDADQLTRIFITTSEKRHPATGGIYNPEGESIAASDIYRINSLDFFSLVQKAGMELIQKEKKLKKTPSQKKASTSKSNPVET
jgi:hypothetical protein